METHKIEVNLGGTFHEVSVKAKTISTRTGVVVEFEFNGVKCLVNNTTNLDFLYRDYSNSWTMDWKEVGPNCVEYNEKVQSELNSRLEKAEIEQQERRKIQESKDAAERETFKRKTQGIKMEFKSQSDWELGRAKNQDPYGNCVYEYAEGWAKLMQSEMANGNKLEDIAEKCSYQLSFLGITGFMYGAAVSVLSNCWIHGESFRKWHNKEYNHLGEGVVNPALLTIKS